MLLVCADRVLEQFLSSDIAERNEMIECYLIGNRLFKFLSVVLPTHHQYFSTNPKHEELRNGSESQLLELLEYMEELELMIDEMEYNRYILNDLTPLRKGSKLMQEIPIAEGNFSERKRIGNRNKDVIVATEPKDPNELNMEKPENRGGKLSQRDAVNNSDQSCNGYRRLHDGKVKEAVHAIEASHHTKEYNSRDPNQMLKQRIAAVVAASSNAELSINKSRSTPSTSTRNTRVGSSYSPNTGNKLLDLFSGKIDTEFQVPLQGNDSSVNKPKLFQDTQISTEQRIRRNETQAFCESPGDSLSWDVDFSKFNVFSTEKMKDVDIERWKTTSTKIDFILDDQRSRGQNQSEKPKTLPKIKNPPISYPRGVRDHSQVRTARSLPSFDKTDLGVADSSALSDCSSDIFLSLENPGLEVESNPIKTKIEERLERAMGSQKERPVVNDLSLSITNYEKSSVLEENSQRKILNQFRDCVRFLLD